ncbi:MAG: thiamine phosphate synthase [Dehalococcoidia bacterium]
MLRLIDANLNRLSEGMRLLEDVARFILNDAALSSRLKALRHDLLSDAKSFQTTLLTARDSERDVTAFSKESMSRSDVNDVVTANARRVTESLRVLEEFAKLPDVDLDPMKFKRARFAIYDIERELEGKVSRRGRRIAGLYVIIDRELLSGKDEVDACRQAIRGGANIIQLRDKLGNKSRILNSARKLKDACVPSGVPFIVNDDLGIALASEADGLHVGQEDIPVSDARRLLAIDKLLGCSTTTVDEARKAEADGADYVAVGSIYPTQSKSDINVVGLDRLREIRDSVSLPIVAIGGINADNARAVVDAGADAVAVISAVLASDDIERAAHKIAERLEAR